MVKTKQTKKTSVKAKKAEPKRAENKFKGYDNAPVIVKIISILNYVNAVLWFVIGVLLIFTSSAMVSYVFETSPELMGNYDPQLATTIMIFVGIFLIGFAVLHLFIGLGLWRLKPWARIAAIILGILGIVTAISSMIMGFGWGQIMNLVIDGFIAGYFLFSKEAKEAFKK